VRALLAVAAIALPLAAASPGTDVFVPLAGWGPQGSPSSCCTTVEVHNPGVGAVEVRFIPVEPTRENTAAAPFVTTLAPGETRRLDDATRLMRDPSPCGALRVVSSARLAVSWAPCPAGAVATAGGGAAALRAAIPSSLAVGVGERTEILADAKAEPAALQATRCRLALVEVTGSPVRVQVTPRDASGAELAPPREYDIGPFSLRWLALGDEFPTVRAAAVRWLAAPISGTGRVLCFGAGPAGDDADPTPNAGAVMNEGKAPPAAGSASQPVAVGRRQ